MEADLGQPTSGATPVHIDPALLKDCLLDSICSADENAHHLLVAAHRCELARDVNIDAENTLNPSRCAAVLDRVREIDRLWMALLREQGMQLELLLRRNVVDRARCLRDAEKPTNIAIGHSFC